MTDPQYFKVGNEKVIVIDSDKPSKTKMALTKEGKKIYFEGNNSIKEKLQKHIGIKNKDNFNELKTKLINKEEYFDSI